jgi:hypothetical protein
MLGSMTLLLAIATPHGHWLCADNEIMRGRARQRPAAKAIQFHQADGTALIGFSGVARVRDRDVVDWLRESLRGTNRGLKELVDEITDMANADLARVALQQNIGHAFAVLCFSEGRPFVGTITNMDPDNLLAPPAGKFEQLWIENLEPGVALSLGSGAAVMGSDLRMQLGRLAVRRPRRSIDYQNVLAGINRRVAETWPRAGVSVSCQTMYLPPKGSVRFRGHWMGPNSGIPSIPIVGPLGVDLTEMDRLLQRMNAEDREATPAELAEMGRRMGTPRR